MFKLFLFLTAEADLLEAIENLKEEYGLVSERMENEQNTVSSLRKESLEMKKFISDLESKNKVLTSNIMQVEGQYKQKFNDLESRLEIAQRTATKEQNSKEDAIAAIDKLENVIKMLQDDMQESQEMALSARATLEAERDARTLAEQSAESLRDELAQIAQAEEKARFEVQEQLSELKSEYEAAMKKLEELQKTKRTRRTTKKTTDETGSEEKPAPKKRGRPRKKKVEEEEQKVEASSDKESPATQEKQEEMEV